VSCMRFDVIKNSFANEGPNESERTHAVWLSKYTYPQLKLSCYIHIRVGSEENLFGSLERCIIAPMMDERQHPNLPDAVVVAVRLRREQLAAEVPKLEASLEEAKRRLSDVQKRLDALRNELRTLSQFLTDGVDPAFSPIGSHSSRALTVNANVAVTNHLTEGAANTLSGASLAGGGTHMLGSVAASEAAGKAASILMHSGVAQPQTADRQISQEIGHRAFILLKNHQFLKTSEIYGQLVKDGLILTAQKPVQRISQILSADTRFKADRANGWSLVEKGDLPTPQSQKDEEPGDEPHFTLESP
jgi:hypothetical protein